MGLDLLRRLRTIAAAAPKSQPWDPRFPTSEGLILPEHWYRSDQGLWQDAGITPADSDGDVVGRWEDIAVASDHVNQGVAANKPTLQSGIGDTLNGHRVVRFDGSNDYLQGAFTNGGNMAQPNTIFVVTSLDAAVVNDDVTRLIIDGDDAGHRQAIVKEGLVAPDSWSIYAATSLVHYAADALWGMFMAVFNGAVSVLWRNDGNHASGNAGANDMDGLTIGARYLGTGPWKGDVVEILIYEPLLSENDNLQVLRYLAPRYGLALIETFFDSGA